MTENTALLIGTRSRLSLPPLDPTVRCVRILSETTQLALSDLCPHELATHTDATRTAYALLVLLRLRTTGVQKRGVSQDVWEDWSSEQRNSRNAQHIESLILSLWTQFLSDYRSPQDIEDVLWLEFPIDEGNHSFFRVVDSLKYNASDGLLSHRLVYLSLMRTWKYGRITSGQSSAWRRFDALCTPRVSHCIELSCLLVYLVALLHFLLYPPVQIIFTSGMQDIGMRELLLILFPITALVRPWSSGTIPFLLAFLAFASCLPSVPLPGDLSFDALLVVFAIHVWQLHFPRTPSPIFLLPFDSALPLCTLLWHSISRALYPILKVFLPVLVLTWFLLYLSLADTFLQLHHLHGSPIDTRIAFFVLFLVELLVLIPSLFIPVLIPPTTSSVDNPGVGLDRYSTPVGLDARKAFLRAVMTYASPHYFPTPVHVLRLLIRLFSVVLRPINLPPGYSVEAEKLLWRVVVGPVAAVIGGLWQL